MSTPERPRTLLGDMSAAPLPGSPFRRTTGLLVGLTLGALLAAGAGGYGIARATEPEFDTTPYTKVAYAQGYADGRGGVRETTPELVEGPQNPDRDGTYIVGPDNIGPGVWRSAGGPDCKWLVLTEQPLRSFLSMAEPGVLNRGGGDALQAVRIGPDAGAFTTTGCGPWTLL